MYLQQVLSKKIFFGALLKVTDEKIHFRINQSQSEVQIHVSGSVPKCHESATQKKSSSGSVSHSQRYGSADPDPYKNVTDP
jgi:hypothetical protein